MLVPPHAAMRAALYLIEALLLAGIIANGSAVAGVVRGGDRKRGRESYVPCPHSKCQCKPDKSGGIVARCIEVSERLPDFSSLNVTFRELILSRRNLVELPDRKFKGVRTKTLDVGSNRLRTGGIGEFAFEGLEDVLETLWLNDCHLNEEPSVSLSILKKLKVLHLEDNNLSEIPAEFLSNNTHLQAIHLNRNRVASISPEAFSQLKNLKQLKLGQNQLSTLPARLFKSLTNLRSLDLSQNSIHAIAAGAFDGLKNLRWLELESNGVAALSQETFLGVRKLKNMKLENNPLTVIGNNTFKPIDQLGYLSIDIANVTSLSAKTFAGLNKLATLSMGETQSDLPQGFFSSMRALKRLSLYDNMGKFTGLRRNMFPDKFSFKKLSVFVTPVRSCRCSEPWIRNMTGLGTYVHGLCSEGRPLSCNDGSSKVPNNDRKIKTPS